MENNQNTQPTGQINHLPNQSDIIAKDGFYITWYFDRMKSENDGYEWDTPIFTAINPCEVLAVSCFYETGTSLCDLELYHDTGSDSPGTGIKFLTIANNTPITVHSYKATDFDKKVILEVGDRITFKENCGYPDFARINITIYLKHLGRGDYK